MDRINRNPSPSEDSSIPNQHHAIQYSSQFLSDTKKPVPLAHFMGARRDLNGPILTKQRVDEREIRPEGWELAEKRSQLNQNGVGSLASFMSGGGSKNQVASHAANLSKRPLPGMTQSNHSDSKSSHSIKSHLDQSDQLNKTNDPTKQPPISHADSFLKPKTLADRLAQLGVSHDAQSIKANSQHINKEDESQSIQTDLSRNVDRLTKPTSTNIPEEISHQRPSSMQTLVNRDAPSHNKLPQVTLNHDLTPNAPSIAHPVETTAIRAPAYKRNNRPQSTLVTLPSSEPASNLSIPSKTMTASLSRLAGSNIVAQRLQWSKEKEQLGTMDEFGSPLIKTSPNLNSPNLPTQIPSPVLPSLNDNPLPPIATTTTSSSSNLDFTRVFSERNKNSNGVKTDSSHRFNASPRLHLPNQMENHHRVKSVDDPIQQKNTNKFNKSIRRSDDDDEFGSSNLINDNDDDDGNRQVSYRDSKRNKKNQILESSIESFANKKKENLTTVDRSIIKIKEDVFQSNPNSPSSSSRFPSNKFRTTRNSHRQSSSIGSTTSPLIINNKNRTQVIQKMTSPKSNSSISARQLPSIPSFSPMMKKGTSELAAVWGTQLANSNKKNNPTESQTPASPTIHLNNRPPLPVPPIHHKTSTAIPLDGRPLPVPPSGSSLNLDADPDPRPRSRPLPVPQAKSSEPFIQTNSEEKPKTSSLKPHGNNVNASMIWAKYEDQRRTFLPEFNKQNEQIEMEIFQLNRTESNEFSTTSLDREDYATFYSQERLLIILKLKSNKKMVLYIWKGSEVREEAGDLEELDPDNDDLKTRIKIEKLLKKYSIDHRSKLIFINHGYEPAELIQALGGKLLLRKGDRFDSVYQRNLSSVFICKSFEISSHDTKNPQQQQQQLEPKNDDKRVVVIEENILDYSSDDQVSTLAHGSILCSGYSGLIKYFHQSTATISLFIWNGRYSHSIEALESRSLALQIRNEVTPLKTDIHELNEGNESEKFLAIFGKSNFAKSYHWRYKPLVPIMSMITDSGGEMKDRITREGVSIVYTGLEIYVIVPPQNTLNNNNNNPSRIKSKKEEHIETCLKLAHSISNDFINKHDANLMVNNSRKRRLPVHAILFPSLIPRDLLASVRFSNDLLRLNDGFGVVDKMNLIKGLNELKLTT